MHGPRRRRPFPPGFRLTGIPWRSREAMQRTGREAVQYAAARHDHRLAGRFQCGRCLGDFIGDGSGCVERHHARLEERRRIVVRHRLHVLRQCERHRSARGGPSVSTRIARGRALNNCAGVHDPVEVTRHGLQRIVGRDIAVARNPRHAAAPGRARVRRRYRRAATTPASGSHARARRPVTEVGRARSDGGGHRHHPAPEVRLGIRDGRVRHGLLVVRTIRRQVFAMLVQRFAHARDVAVSEDGEYARRRGVRPRAP